MIAASIQFAFLIAFGTWAYMTSERLDTDQELSTCRRIMVVYCQIGIN